MKIKAAPRDYEKWIESIPQKGDLLFLSKDGADILKSQSLPVHSRAEMKAHIDLLYGLNSCTWYCYALSRADYWAWLPLGTLETLNVDVLSRIAKEQVSFGVPTVLTNSLPKDLKGKLLELSIGSWITSASWSQLSYREQALTIHLWSVQNEINEYDSVDLDALPSLAREELFRLGFDTLLNQFQKMSGPNCFAAVAGATAFGSRDSFCTQWIHWPQLEDHLFNHGYETVDSFIPTLGDVLVFSENDIPIHASYFIGDGLYFEKPGQDFFEPYRVQQFEKWREDWPQATLSLWRNFS